MVRNGHINLATTTLVRITKIMLNKINLIRKINYLIFLFGSISTKKLFITSLTEAEGMTINVPHCPSECIDDSVVMWWTPFPEAASAILFINGTASIAEYIAVTGKTFNNTAVKFHPSSIIQETQENNNSKLISVNNTHIFFRLNTDW